MVFCPIGASLGQGGPGSACLPSLTGRLDHRRDVCSGWSRLRSTTGLNAPLDHRYKCSAGNRWSRLRLSAFTYRQARPPVKMRFPDGLGSARPPVGMVRSTTGINALPDHRGCVFREVPFHGPSGPHVYLCHSV